MRKVLVGGLAAVALIVLAATFAAAVWAQAQPPRPPSAPDAPPAQAQPPRPPRAPDPPPAPRADVFTFRGAGSGIGASVRDLRSEEIASARLPQPGGVLVQEVREDSPASRAGLRSGDIVVDFDGERVRSARHFMRLVRETAPGRVVKSTVVRDGARRQVDITPEAGERFAMTLPDIGPAIERGLRRIPRDLEFDFDFDFPRDWDLPGPGARVFPRGRLGVTLSPLTDQLATFFGVEDGVLVSSVEADSPAGRAGIRAGDVITSVNGRRVRGASDVTRAVRDAGAGATIDVQLFRDKKETGVKVTLPERAQERPAVLPV